jgi:RNA polymerase sigma-70 factor, ECF subfamily
VTQSPTAGFENDVVLLSAVARGDAAAVESLYHAYADGVFRFVYRRLENCYEDAEEVTQDTFLSAIRLAPGYRNEAAAFTWLCGIAKLRIADHFRSRNRGKRVPAARVASLHGNEALASVPDPCPPLDALIDRASAIEMVDHMLALLTDDERDALLLRYDQQFSVREIGLLMKRSEKAIESLLTRAKRKIRQQVSESD